MIERTSFGQVAGRPASAFTVTGDGAVSLRLTDYGARLTELHVPGSDGTTADVVLGFDDVESYVESPAYFGATVGRYGNRIRRGRFTLAGVEYFVDRNEKDNHLHGGRHGWDSRIWDVDPYDPGGTSVTFRTTSADGEMGFPGACAVSSTYTLEDGALRIVMEAVPDALTVINMVHHSYFNLAGHASGDVLGQHMRLAADHYVPVDDELLASGEILRVEGTPFDFRELHPINEHLDLLPAVGSAIFEEGGGWDHNWCLRDAGDVGLREAAEIVDPASGRRLVLHTSDPGVQMYTGGYLDESIVGKGAQPYCRYAGFTLETQKFPDSPRFAHYPSATVRAGETYRNEMLLEFYTL